MAALLANNSHAKTALRVTLQQSYHYPTTSKCMVHRLSRSVGKKPLKYERLKYPAPFANGKYCGSESSMWEIK